MNKILKSFYLTLLFTLLTTGVSQAQNSKVFQVKGNISTLADSEIFLSYIINGEKRTDTTVTKGGCFSIKGSIDEPCVAMLNNSDNSIQRLFLLDNSVIELNGVYSKPTTLTVKGGKPQMEYENLQVEIMKNREDVIAVYKSEGEGAKYDSLYRNERSIIMRFIKEHPDSYLSANQLFYNTNENNLSESITLYKAFSEKVKNSYEGKKVAERIKTLQKVKVGNQALNFTQLDTLGKPVQLSDFKGKYILLEFWASWCGPCRAEGPNIFKAFTKYKDKGFVILAVSLDKDEVSWKRAIVKDNLPWIHVSDLKYFRNEVAELYGVHGIPTNFLIDPEGKIIDKDLRGDKLHVKLGELFE